MKYLTLGLLTLGLAIGLTVMVVQHDSGYVLINYGSWSMETTFNIFTLLALLAFIALYYAVRLILGTWHLPSKLSSWKHGHKAVGARKLTNQGLIALAEANWKRAEKLLSQSALHSDTPLINYLGAAQAAQKQGADLRRDDYLSQAYHSMPDAELAVGLTQAEVQLSHRQTEQALATLNHLRSIAPKHAQVIYLLKKLYEKLEDWDSLYDLLVELRKGNVLDEKALLALEFQVHHNRLLACNELEQLEQCWQAIPKRLRQSPQLLHDYARRLMRLGDEQKAEAQLNEYLKREWDPLLIRLFGLVQGADPGRQLATAEHWLGEYGQHADLLLTLGRLNLRNQLWGKARSYLEASLGIKPQAETCCELGTLLQQLGEKEKAAGYFRQGLELASGAECIRIVVPKQHEGRLAPAAPGQPVVAAEAAVTQE